mmetsp:Transcript_23900/g.43855  ORF Transcript_23900/g.43855 Transcript_23900/m.43855 type:complete len:223 (+) Transcript_23900:406-1074(+)
MDTRSAGAEQSMPAISSRAFWTPVPRLAKACSACFRARCTDPVPPGQCKDLASMLYTGPPRASTALIEPLAVCRCISTSWRRSAGSAVCSSLPIRSTKPLKAAGRSCPETSTAPEKVSGMSMVPLLPVWQPPFVITARRMLGWLACRKSRISALLIGGVNALRRKLAPNVSMLALTWAMVALTLRNDSARCCRNTSASRATCSSCSLLAASASSASSRSCVS